MRRRKEEHRCMAGGADCPKLLSLLSEICKVLHGKCFILHKVYKPFSTRPLVRMYIWETGTVFHGHHSQGLFLIFDGSILPLSGCLKPVAACLSSACACIHGTVCSAEPRGRMGRASPPPGIASLRLMEQMRDAVSYINVGTRNLMKWL